LVREPSPPSTSSDPTIFVRKLGLVDLTLPPAPENSSDASLMRPARRGILSVRSHYLGSRKVASSFSPLRSNSSSTTTWPVSIGSAPSPIPSVFGGGGSAGSTSGDGRGNADADADAGPTVHGWECQFALSGLGAPTSITKAGSSLRPRRGPTRGPATVSLRPATAARRSADGSGEARCEVDGGGPAPESECGQRLLSEPGCDGGGRAAGADMGMGDSTPCAAGADMGARDNAPRATTRARGSARIYARARRVPAGTRQR
jgi:hypothetical protein